MKHNLQIDALVTPIARLVDAAAPLKVHRTLAAHSRRCALVISTRREARRNQPDVCATFRS
jgi:hypothetical protein